MSNLHYNKEEFNNLCEKYNLFLVVLHGSYAKGIVTPKSDIDVGFLGAADIIKGKYFEILKDFSAIFGDRFDPVFMNGAEAMIIYQIAINGIPLYEKTKGFFNYFKVSAIARYFDTKKFRVLEKEYIKSAIQKME